MDLNFHRQEQDEDLQGRPAQPERDRRAATFKMVPKRQPNRKERRTTPAKGFNGPTRGQKGCFGKPRCTRGGAA
jgi:hypothetical protein